MAKSNIEKRETMTAAETEHLLNRMLEALPHCEGVDRNFHEVLFVLYLLALKGGSEPK